MRDRMINWLMFGVDRLEVVPWEDGQSEFSVDGGGPWRWFLPFRRNNLRLNTSECHPDTCDQKPVDIRNLCYYCRCPCCAMPVIHLHSNVECSSVSP